MQKSNSLEDAQKYSGRAEIISLAQKHIEELEALEKKRFTEKMSSDRSALMSGAISIKIDPTLAKISSDNPFISNLPPIDDEPEVTEGLKMLQGLNQDLVLFPL